jgi:cell division septum initiation protein DivIVA
MGDPMSEQSHLSADLGHEDQFEREMRGYSRRAVDEYVAALRIDLRGLEDGKRDMEDRLSQSLDEIERLKLELSAARSNGKPPHQEISERIGQILQLADDEAKSQRSRADEEIAKLRTDAQTETTKLRTDAKADTDKIRAEAQEQAERMLGAAQEQADNTVATAKAEADSARKSAATEAQQVLGEATKQAETAVATAKSQAKQQLDEATARATAIHDGAERRLNLLMSRHSEAIRRLTEIRDVVTSLVAGEADRGSLDDEVSRIVASAVAGDAQSAGRAPGNGRPVGPNEGRHAGGLAQPDGQPTLSAAHRPSPSQAAGAAQRSAAAQQSAAQPSSAQGAGQASGTTGTGTGRQAQAPGNGQHTGAAEDQPAPTAADAAESDDTADGIAILPDVPGRARRQ